MLRVFNPPYPRQLNFAAYPPSLRFPSTSLAPPNRRLGYISLPHEAAGWSPQPAVSFIYAWRSSAPRRVTGCRGSC